MDLYMSAPEGDSLSQQELTDILQKAKSKIDDWAIVSEEPLQVEATLEGQQSLLSARGTAGRLRFVHIENPQDSIFSRLCPILEKRGWQVDGE